MLVDGGIGRGTDVVKALCLGARRVGIGRAASFELGAGGVAHSPDVVPTIIVFLEV